MEVPQVAIKQEKLDSFTDTTESRVKYETQSLDVPQIKLEPVKLEPCTDVSSIPTNLDQQLQFAEESQMMATDGNYMSECLLNQSQSKEEGLDIKLEGIEEMDSEMIDDLDDKKWKIENNELNIKEDENVTDEEHRNSPKLVQQQQPKDGLAERSKMKIREGNYGCEQSDYQNTHQRLFIEKLYNFKCGLCEFKTMHTEVIKRHIAITHNKPIGMNIMYKCVQCDYKTVRNSSLRRHVLIHKDFGEVNSYKFDQCDFQTVHKRALQLHIPKHKNPDEITMYKCDQCGYQTARKQSLKLHTLTHKQPDEVDVFKCDQCYYQAVQQRYLKSHILKHKNLDEVDVHKCEQCGYQTLYKNIFKRHMLQHKNVDEVKSYKCDKCDYKTVYKANLQRHILRRHKNPDQVDL